MVAATGALIGFSLMAFFLATGAVSPEPHHRPEWLLRVMGTLPGHVLYLCVMLLCLPAFELTRLLIRDWNLLFWVVACIMQMILYSGVAVGVAELIRWLRA